MPVLEPVAVAFEGEDLGVATRRIALAAVKRDAAIERLDKVRDTIARTAQLHLDAERLGATVIELDDGTSAEPYCYQYGREEWLLVLAGAPTLRHPAGTERLLAGDLVCFADGPTGGHQLTGSGDGVTRVLSLSTQGFPASVHYPDTDTWLLHHGADDPTIRLRR